MKTPEIQSSMGNTSFYTVIKIDSHLYGIDIRNVEKITRAVSISSIANGPECLLGLLNSGGTMIPVVNIRKKFAMNEREIRAKDRVIFFRAKTLLCFFADAVEGVVQLTKVQLQKPQEIHPALADYIEGIGHYGASPLTIIDLARFFNETELTDMATIAQQHVRQEI